MAWPEDRAEVSFGTVTLTARVDDAEPERRKIIFDPVPRIDEAAPKGAAAGQRYPDMSTVNR